MNEPAENHTAAHDAAWLPHAENIFHALLPVLEGTRREQRILLACVLEDAAEALGYVNALGLVKAALLRGGRDSR